MSDPSAGPPDPGRRGRRLEDVFIILCIFSLWPTVLRWQHPAVEYVLYLALAGLVYILFRRIRRFQRARDEFRRLSR